MPEGEKTIDDTFITTDQDEIELIQDYAFSVSCNIVTKTELLLRKRSSNRRNITSAFR